MKQEQAYIGRVTRSSTLGFVGAVRLPEPDMPAFGSFCRAEAQRGQSWVIGLIYDISIEDDAFARQVATADSLTPEQLADTQFNRQVPVEFSALAVGFQNGRTISYSLPPQPPLTLAPIHPMASDELVRFTESLGFIPLVLAADEVPADELIAASLRLAAAARPGSERRGFLVRAGAECARLLPRDLVRLGRLLRSLGS